MIGALAVGGLAGVVFLLLMFARLYDRLALLEHRIATLEQAEGVSWHSQPPKH